VLKRSWAYVDKLTQNYLLFSRMSVVILSKSGPIVIHGCKL